MSDILLEITRVREIMGLIKEQSNEEITVTFRDDPNIDATRVDKFTIQGSTGEGTANILKNGEVIDVEVMGGLATVTGVRAVGNELIVDVEAPLGQGGAKTMGKFIIDEITEDYKFEPNNEIYGQLKGDDKADFDAFVAAIEEDKEFATQVIASVEGITDFNPSEYGVETDVIDANIRAASPEIQEWADGQIEILQRLINNEDTDEDDREDYSLTLLNTQQDPVDAAQVYKEMVCRFFNQDGMESYEDECQMMTSLLEDLDTEVEDLTDFDIDSNVKVVYNQKNGIPLWLSGATITVRQDIPNLQLPYTEKEYTTDENGDVTITTIGGMSASVTTTHVGYEPNDLTLDDDFVGLDIEIDMVPIKIASELPIEGCTDPDYVEYNEKAKIDDGSCETFAKTVKDLKSELKTQWETEVKKQLDIVGSGDIYGFVEAYSLQNKNKMEAVLVMLRNLLCVSARVAKALILTQNKTMDYSTEKLITAADSPGVGEGHIDLVAGIKRNLKLIDKSFKWGLKKKNRELSNVIDKKIEPIKAQLNRAADFIDALTPYINWDEEITFGDGRKFRAGSTHEILMNSKNKRETIINCAE
jgi:hypothetical protein|tara:strand:- start:2687 stop:4447 length:1761 start_codon:yes stop_codon:yes gene_type:complete